MLSARIGREIVIKVVNKIGVLSDMSRIIADKGISIEAVSCWTEGREGIVHLITDDNLRATEALCEKGYDAFETKVVVADIPNKPGILKHVTDLLRAAEIDIHHLYATPAQAEQCHVVLSCSDNEHATVMLNHANTSYAVPK
jgi:hypothetical protein